MADDERVILGKKGSDYGLWVTKTGVSFTDNPTTKDLLFDSNVAETGLSLIHI